MRNARCLPNGTSHYQVVSPVMQEPPDEYVHYETVAAHSKREAKILALKTDEFACWRTEAGGNPFVGLVAELTRCAHGVCWECDATDASTGCAECDADVDWGEQW